MEPVPRVLGAAMATVTACGGDDPAARDGESSGASIFAEHCASCHGADGSGGQGPALGDGVVAEAFTEDEMRAVVSHGRNGMPPFADTLTDDELDAVVTYVRSELRTSEDEAAGTVTGDGPRGRLTGVPPEHDAERRRDDWSLANGDLA